ncbi:hypothetical protein CERSUDRAFT_78039 [Gelatoporia subvermispora B]|uniref:Uncharacterized protein n=1 Tax=Ceriporiopsis subvermispora (strain B) TaxID=914234 RepID=M2QYH5_CERS8|nr:hypothetical protein CERSUDRAFT_78039 [Gelatoporia subvermispora B]
MSESHQTMSRGQEDPQRGQGQDQHDSAPTKTPEQAVGSTSIHVSHLCLPKRYRYYGCAWSLTHLRKWARKLVDLDPETCSRAQLQTEMMFYFEHLLNNLDMTMDLAIYEEDRETRETYSKFVLDVARVKDHQEILILVLRKGIRIQGAKNPIHWKYAGLKEHVEEILGPARWWEIAIGNEDDPMHEWYNPETGERTDLEQP